MGWRAEFVWFSKELLVSRKYLIVGILLAGSSAVAQPPARRARPDGPPPAPPGDFAFVRGEFGITNRVVVGQPYSAQAVTQFNRVLADGNRIQRTTTALMARDTGGRTRIERSLASIGPLATSGDGAKVIIINDPVGGTSYVLDPDRHTYRQMPASPRNRFGRNAPPGSRPDGLAPFRSTPRSGARNSAGDKTEDLGLQTMQGVSVQGKRMTRTIAPGEVGNDRDIEIVTESWYSPDLQLVVMSKTSDPRFGETIYQLTNINRGEPERSLFVLPSDYSVNRTRPFRDQ